MGKIEEKGWGVGGDFYVQMGLGKVTRILGDRVEIFSIVISLSCVIGARRYF